MNVPLRMIGIASTFFWIFLIGFSASAAYSVKDLNFNFGEPTTEFTNDNKIIFSLPIILINKGLYSVRFFNITTVIFDESDYVIAEGSTFVPVVKRDEEVTTFHNVTIDVNELLQRNQNYLFNDTELRISETVSLKIAEVIPVQASVSNSMPWGAPLYNFTVGNPEFAVYNLTHIRVILPIGFENHATFDLAGTVQIRMYNNTGSLMGSGENVFNVLQHSLYNGNMEIYVPYNSTAEIPQSGYFEVYLQTSLFNYGPVRIDYGGEQ